MNHSQKFLFLARKKKKERKKKPFKLQAPIDPRKISQTEPERKLEREE